MKRLIRRFVASDLILAALVIDAEDIAADLDQVASSFRIDREEEAEIRVAMERLRRFRILVEPYVNLPATGDTDATEDR